MPGFKAFEDRVTFLLGDDVAGYKLKSFVIWPSGNPMAFRLSIGAHCQYTRSSKK
jgi:hypothetical protein